MRTAILRRWPATEGLGIATRAAGPGGRALAGVVAFGALLALSPSPSPPRSALPAGSAASTQPAPQRADSIAVPDDVSRGLDLLQQGRLEEARAALLAALPRHRRDFWGGRILFVLGYAEVGDKRYKQALEYLRDPQILKSGLEDLSILYQAHAYFNLDEMERAAQAYAYFMTTYKESAFRAEAAKMLGDALAKLDRNVEAAASYETALWGAADWETPALMYRRADCLEKGGSPREALAVLEKMYVEYPAYYRDRDVQSGIADLRRRLGVHLGFAPEQIESRAVHLAGASAHRSAYEEYARLKSAYPSYFAAHNLWLDQAEEALDSGNRAAARDLLAGDAPKRDASGRAYLLLAELQRQYGKDPVPYWEAASRVDSPAAQIALCRLSASRLESGERQKAAQSAEEVARRFPGDSAAFALWRVAWSEYASGSFSQAAAHFTNCAQASPQGKYVAAASYWSARSLERAGSGADAANLYREVLSRYPRTLYAYRVAATLGIPAPSASDPPAVDTVAQRTAYLQEARGKLPQDVQRAWDRAELLRLCRLYPLALRELAFQKRTAEDDVPLLIQTAVISDTMGAHRDAIITLRQAFPDYLRRQGSDLPRFIWEMFYPDQYRDIFEKQARLLGIRTNLLLGLSCQESCFNPVARSHSGAVGVMQLLPSTAHDIARRNHLPYSYSLLLDPASNIALGSRFVAGLLRDLDGDEVYTLIAYNAGPGRVTSWKRMMPTLTGLEVAECAPFSETRDYVVTVLQNSCEYRRLYGE